MPSFTPRQAITLAFIAFGTCAGANLGAIPVLKDQSGVTAFIFGFMASLGMLSNILMMSLGGFINKRFDHRSVLLFSLPLLFVGLVYSLTAKSVWSFALSFVLFNLALGLLDLFMNAEGSVVEHNRGKPTMSSFHGTVLYAIGIFAMIGSYISVNYGPLWTALPALPVIVIAYYAIWKAIPHRIQDQEDTPKPNVILPRKILFLIGAVVGLEVAAELTCVQWSGQLLAHLQPSLAAYSGLGVAFYGLCNGTLRMIGDPIRARFGDVRILVTSLLTGILGFAILASAPGFVVSVLAFAVAGIGLSLIFPIMFSMAARLAPDARATALAFVSAVGGPPRIILPIILGSLANAYGLSAIFIAAGMTASAALGFVIWVGQEIANIKRAQVSLRPAS